MVPIILLYGTANDAEIRNHLRIQTYSRDLVLRNNWYWIGSYIPACK